MIRNYLKIAVRNLWKHKTFTIVNIVGLAVAFGATLLLSLTAFHELSFDRFHVNKQSLYLLYTEGHEPGKADISPSMPVPLSPTLKKEYPEILHASRFGYLGNSVLRYKDHEFNYDIRTVDPDFIEMFSFPLQQGDPKKALQDQGSIVLTEKVARSVFGQEPPIGRTVQIKTGEEWKPYIVSGIAGDFPENSTLQFSALIRFENFPWYKANQNKWDNRNHEVYVQLAPQTSQTAFEQKTIKFIHKYFDSAVIQMKLDGGVPDKDGEYMRLRMVPMPDLHFASFGASVRISRFYPYLLLLIGAFILFIASVNFVNLSMGRAFTRAREIGVRKVLGAARKQILFQFWGEAIVICTASLAAGIALAFIF
ncbi:MAG TPA: ABC transporter permease, partial [Puia sp.]|nr:ABC transporter permease [Puia sp.]